ncbi:hypothetical protein, partial [Anabaena sp. CCY 9402-a]|uniref:hypothetical protein n=1 Tax=Anabaena sp. CCY 9402-a TaxID=3103867 RepID=UPI0039C708F9
MGKERISPNSSKYTRCTWSPLAIIANTYLIKSFWKYAFRYSFEYLLFLTPKKMGEPGVITQYGSVKASKLMSDMKFRN